MSSSVPVTSIRDSNVNNSDLHKIRNNLQPHVWSPSFSILSATISPRAIRKEPELWIQLIPAYAPSYRQQSACKYGLHWAWAAFCQRNIARPSFVAAEAFSENADYRLNLLFLVWRFYLLFFAYSFPNMARSQWFWTRQKRHSREPFSTGVLFLARMLWLRRIYGSEVSSSVEQPC